MCRTPSWGVAATCFRSAASTIATIGGFRSDRRPTEHAATDVTCRDWDAATDVRCRDWDAATVVLVLPSEAPDVSDHFRESRHHQGPLTEWSRSQLDRSREAWPEGPCKCVDQSLQFGEDRRIGCGRRLQPMCADVPAAWFGGCSASSNCVVSCCGFSTAM